MADDAPTLAMQSALAPMTPSAPPLPQESANVRHERELVGKIEAGMEGQRQTFEEGQARMDPIRDRLMNVLESPAAARAHLEKVKEAPKPEDYQKYTLQFASGMAVLGAFAGKFTRAGGTAALDAFGSAIKGWQDGNLQAYHSAMEEWRANTEKTLANNQVELQKYREIIENKRLTVEQMMAALNIESARFQNKVMFDATQSQNYEMAFRLTDTLEKNAQRLQGSLDFFGRSMEEAKHNVASQVDALERYPQLMQNMKPEDYLRLKGAAETFRLTMPAPPSHIGGSQPRSAPAMYMQSWMAQNPKAGPDEIAEAMANFNAAQSAGRGLGTRFAQTGFAAEEARGTFDQALAASDALPRGKFVPLNRWKQTGQAAMSDPAFRQFRDANEAAVTAYGATMSRSGVNTVASQKRAHDVLDTADSPQAYRAGIEQLQREVEIVESAPEHARKAILDRLFGRHAAETSAAAGAGNDGWGEVKVH